jgi:hypothetical protein
MFSYGKLRLQRAQVLIAGQIKITKTQRPRFANSIQKTIVKEMIFLLPSCHRPKTGGELKESLAISFLKTV